jgi:hypothetical protein
MHDLHKYARMQKNVEFCAHCAVNMLQNNGRQVTQRDIINISCAAFLPHFGGGERQYSVTNTNKVYGYSSVMALFCLKGTGTNVAQIKWFVGQNGLGTPSYRSFWIGGTVVGQWIKFARGLQINSDYSTDMLQKGLTIQNGQVKMVLYVSLYIDNSFVMPNGKNIASTPSLWGLFILKPKEEIVDGRFNGYFCTTVVFTPKSGLFNENSPW